MYPLIRSSTRALIVSTLLLASVMEHGRAQGPDGDPVLVLATIEEAASGQRAGIERVQQLLADNQLEEAVESLRRVMDADNGRLLPLSDRWERDAGFDRWMTVRAVCQWRIAGWATSHPAALELYRQRVDPLAERWYRQGIEQRDRALLERLTDQLLMSRRGDDALLALGDWALERGDFAAARGAWQQIHPALRTPEVRSPLLRTPPGRPWWITMEAARFPASPESWTEIFDAPLGHPSWLAYPDTDLNLADIRARLVLASILEQSWRRAELELAWFRHFHADARGKLAGRDGLWTELLGEQLTRARDWPAAWKAEPIDADWPTLTGGAAGANRALQKVDPPGSVTWHWPPTRTAQARQALDQAQDRGTTTDVEISYPLVVGGRVIFVAGPSLVALDLSSGAAAFGERAAQADTDSASTAIAERRPGEIYHLASPGIEREDEGAVIGRLPGWLAAEGTRVFAVLGGGTFRRGNRASVQQLPAALVGLDLAAEGKVFLNLALTGDRWGTDWQWDGSPLVDEALVYVCLQRTDGVRAEVHVAAFDTRTGRLRWRQFVAASDARGRADSTHAWLTRNQESLYCNTNAGAIACLSTSDGKIRWLTRYAREQESDGNRDRALRLAGAASDGNPPLLSGDQLFVAPTDSAKIFSLDANTGQVLWATPRQGARPVPRLLGTTPAQLMASGESLSWFDVATGVSRGEFPAGSHAIVPGHARREPRGVGRGVLVGADVWWPARDEIFIFRQESRQDRSGWIPQGVGRIDLRSRGAMGGDLMIVGNVLLVHDRRGIQALVP